MNIREFSKLLRKMSIKDIVNLALFSIDYNREPLKLNFMPFFIQIEPTTRCNLKCDICMNPRMDKKEDMSLDDFKAIIDKLPHIRKISLTGRGETLLNRNIFDMVKYAKSKGIIIGFATNGLLLTHENIEKIILSGLDWINISVDSASKQKLEEMRKGLNYGMLVANIKKLKERVGNGPKPHISIWAVITQKNIDELEDVLLLTKNLGIENISFQKMHTWGSNDFKSPDIEDERLFYKLTECYALAAEHKLRLSHYNIPFNKDRKRACKKPWFSCYITVEGYVTPCCLHGSDPGLVNFGNVLENDFTTIWNCKEYKIFREKLKAIKPPSICSGCTGYSRNARIS